MEAYPLQWPQGQPRTPDYMRRAAAFKTTQNTAQIGVLEEIRRLGGRNPVISTMIRVRNDGLPYAQQGKISDPGVAVYFQYKKKPMCFACDKWKTIGDNMQAIRKTIEALRGIERWGSGEMMERAFTGFAALPNPEPHWSQVLDVAVGASIEEIEAGFRRMAAKYHPDREGGSSERMAQINAARDKARKERQ